MLMMTVQSMCFFSFFFLQQRPVGGWLYCFQTRINLLAPLRGTVQKYQLTLALHQVFLNHASWHYLDMLGGQSQGKADLCAPH